MKILALTLGLSIAAAVTLLAAAAAKSQGEKLYHLVAFKFKDTATPEQIKQVEQAFAALPKKISGIRSLEWGLNNSPEKLNKGCTHGFVLTFTSDKERDAYLVHPEHKAFGGLVGPLLGDVFVLDFWARK
jgi:hypothetical protein